MPGPLPLPLPAFGCPTLPIPVGWLRARSVLLVVRRKWQKAHTRSMSGWPHGGLETHAEHPCLPACDPFSHTQRHGQELSFEENDRMV